MNTNRDEFGNGARGGETPAGSPPPDARPAPPSPRCPLSASPLHPSPGRCRRVAPLLRLYVEGELAPAEAEKVEAHLAACPRCARQAKDVGLLRGMVSGLPAPAMAPGFMERMGARLDRERVPALPLWRRFLERTAVGGRHFPLGLTAAAVLILVTAGVLLWPAKRITAQEVSTRVEASWAGLQDYHCTLETTCSYRGRQVTTTRRQWFRKPDHFRIEADDAPRRVTFINGDDVVVYLPDAGIAIRRPRRASETDLPFPFRSAEDLQGDITVDAMLQRLRETSDAELAGEEEVLGKPCHVLTFRTMRPPSRQIRRPRAFDCRMWVDRVTFLPLKVKMHYDSRIWSLTRATDLDVNEGLDRDLFEPEVPAGVRWIYGDVEPRLFIHRRSTILDRSVDARLAAKVVLPRVGFPVLTPSWLPEGYRVMAASTWEDLFGGKVGRRYTVTLLNDAGSAVTIIQEPPADEQKQLGEALFSTEAGTHPYIYQRLEGMRAGVSVRIMAANLPRADVIHLLRALRTEAELAAVEAKAEAASSEETRGS